MRSLLLIVFLVAVLGEASAQWVAKSQPGNSPAQCGQAGVVCATSCRIGDVQAAIAKAQPGNTVVLPACINTTPGLTLCAPPNQGTTCGGSLASNEWNADIGLSPAEGTNTPPASLKHINIVGQGVGQTIIIDSNNKTGPKCEAAISVDDSYNSLQNGIQLPAPGTPGLTDPIRVSGMTLIQNTIDTGAQCRHVMFFTGSHALHIDHLDFIGLTNKDTGIDVSGDPWGVIDHITAHAVAGSYVDRLIAAHHQSWQAIGAYGDNTWAQPPTYGTVQQMYIESITPDHNGSVWCEFGGRCTVRNSTISRVATHGTESGQRVRSGRFYEIYNNTFTCLASAGGGAGLSSYRGGTWLFWGNTLDTSGGCYGGNLGNAVASLYRSFDRFRPWGPLATNPPTPLNTTVRGACDGTGQYDQNTPPVYQGTADVSSTLNHLVVAGTSPGWQTNQWVGYALNNATGAAPPVQTNGAPCTPNPPNTNVNADGTTGPWGSWITANDDHTITTNASQYNGTASCQAGGAHNWAAGDTFYIANNFYNTPITAQCIDEPGHGSGALLSGGFNSQPWNCQPGGPNGTGPSCTPNPGQVCRDGPNTCGWVNEVLDPAYGWLNTNAVSGSLISPLFIAQSNGAPIPIPMVRYNREIYNDGPGFNNGANPGPASTTGGIGVGTFAAMPTTCQPQVAYWATDRQILYQCTAPNTWTQHYQPFTFPHPLTLQSLADRLGHIIETGDGHTLIRIKARQPVRKARRKVRRKVRKRQRQQQRRREH